jgi:hypothetical protein
MFGKAICIFCTTVLFSYTCDGAIFASDKVNNFDKSVVITNLTDPAMPGKLSVIVGDGWDVGLPTLKFMKFKNSAVQNPSKMEDVLFTERTSKTLRVVKTEPQVLTCDFPDDKFSVYAIVAKGKDGLSKPVIVNAAKTEWLSKETASPGDTLRVFGRNLVNLDLYAQPKGFEQSPGYGAYLKKTSTRISLKAPDGAFQSCTILKASAYDVYFVIPASLPDGKYGVYAHNGLGGINGWSETVELTVQKKKEWPAKIFNVKDFGAVGEVTDSNKDGGWNNDNIAIQKALDAAGNNGGGIVYFPAGSYFVAKTLSIPKYTVLRGESRERSWIWFPDSRDHGKESDFENAPKVQIGFRGLSNFKFENLSIHSVYTNLLIAAPMTKDNANEYSEIDLSQRADNVTIQNCNIVHEPYYHYHPEDPLFGNNNQFDQSWGMKATIAIHGDNTSISNSRIRGGGMAIVLISCRYSRIANNELVIGRHANAIATREFGYPELPCPQKIIIEDNIIWPATPIHHSAIWCHAVTRDMFVARNNIQLTWGTDAEGLLWHGWYPEKSFETQSATENTIVARDVDKIEALGWECIIVSGKGLGQKRMIKEIKGNTLVMDKPWDLIPGEGSKVELMYYHVHDGITIVQNRLSDMGAGIYAWGGSWNWIVDGNSLTRCGGVMLEKVAYSPSRAWSGNYFDQILYNKVDQGRYDNTINRNGFGWTRGYSGTGGYREFGLGTIANLGHIYRGNLSTNDCTIAFWDKVLDYWDKEPDNPGYYIYKGPLNDVGMVVEDNWFKDCKLGISIGDAVSGVERGNKYNNVNTKVKRSLKADMINDDKSR